MARAKRAKVLASALGKQLPSNFGLFLSFPRLVIFWWVLLNIMYSLRKEVGPWDVDMGYCDSITSSVFIECRVL